MTLTKRTCRRLGVITAALLWAWNISGCDLEAAANRRARLLKARSDLRSIHRAAQDYKAVRGRWPSDIEELVFTRDTEVQFICDYNSDPWGHEYVYALTPNGPVVTCFGADGTRGGQGEAADLLYP